MFSPVFCLDIQASNPMICIVSSLMASLNPVQCVNRCVIVTCDGLLCHPVPCVSRNRLQDLCIPVLDKWYRKRKEEWMNCFGTLDVRVKESREYSALHNDMTSITLSMII